MNEYAKSHIFIIFQNKALEEVVLDKELIEILACPVCKGELIYREDKEVLVCSNCKVYYEVREGIPVLLPDSGKPLKEEDS